MWQVCLGTDLFCRCWAQVLVPLQQTLAESRLVRRRFHSGERHLTLAKHNSQNLVCWYRQTETTSKHVF